MTELYELRDEVSTWVERSFDYIPLQVIEDFTKGNLADHLFSGSYPTWGTLFHLRGPGSAAFIEAAEKAGFSVFTDIPEFDGITLGVDGGGYSFWGDHWIPLYLEIRGRTSEFEGVSFDSL